MCGYSTNNWGKKLTEWCPQPQVVVLGCSNVVSFSTPSRWDWHPTDALQILREAVGEALPASSHRSGWDFCFSITWWAGNSKTFHQDGKKSVNCCLKPTSCGFSSVRHFNTCGFPPQKEGQHPFFRPSLSISLACAFFWTCPHDSL